MTERRDDSRSDAPLSDEARARRKIEAKAAWAARMAARAPRAAADPATRLPPGQHWSQTWPVLDLGDRPRIAPAEWRLLVDGAVAAPFEVGYEDLRALPQVSLVRDFHCVTTWSTRDNLWTGVRLAELLGRALPSTGASWVTFTGADRSPEDGEPYTTNVRLDDCLAEDALLVHSWNDLPLPAEHGGPVRVVIPALYAWKSAKWVIRATVREENVPGFWEQRGYSDTALPWRDDRFRGDAVPPGWAPA